MQRFDPARRLQTELTRPRTSNVCGDISIPPVNLVQLAQLEALSIVLGDGIDTINVEVFLFRTLCVPLASLGLIVIDASEYAAKCFVCLPNPFASVKSQRT